MKLFFIPLLLFPLSTIAQSLHQLSTPEINLLNISSIECSGPRVNVKFVFNGAGRSGVTMIIGMEHSEKVDTLYYEHGKIQTENITSMFGGYLVRNEYYYSDTVVNNTKIYLVDSIRIYWQEKYDQTIKFKYVYDLEKIREVHDYLIGNWTLCHTFSTDFASYDTDVDSLFFVRDIQSCSFNNGKYSNGHCLTFVDNDSIRYHANLKGKERKVGIPYFTPCSKWHYDMYGLDIAYVQGNSAMYGEVRIEDQDHFWLVFDTED